MKQKRDNEYAPTTAAYAVVNKRWSKKRFSGYFSPDGDRYDAPSGLTRTATCWKSKDVSGKMTLFNDREYGGYRESHKAAMAHHVSTTPLLNSRRFRTFRERSTKTTHLGVAGLYVYFPKHGDLPLSKTNRWKIFASPAGTRTKNFAVPYNTFPGHPVFDAKLLEAAVYCEKCRDEYFKINAFIRIVGKETE